MKKIKNLILMKKQNKNIDNKFEFKKYENK